MIRGRLGAGGAGSVYHATDELRRADVALKVLHDGDAHGLDALKREFRSRRDLSFPGLVRLHELFSDGNLHFFTMDLVHGLPFVKHVRHPTAPFGYDPKLLALALKGLVESIDYLHKRGRIHRDIKSENVLVNEDGRPILLDFGLMLGSERASSPNLPTEGTPGYLAPEVTSGQPVTQASDAYSLGALLYHCLTGWLPQRERAGSLTEDTPSPSSLGVKVDPELERICLGLLEPRPQDRLGIEALISLLGGGLQSIDAPAELVGRTRELQVLSDQLQAIGMRPDPDVLFVEGRSGVGKSALLEHFLAHEEPHAWVFRGRCHEREAVLFQALDEVVDQLVSKLEGLPPEQALELVSPRDALALVRVFSAVSRLPLLLGIEDGEVSADPREVRRDAHRALDRVLGRLSETRPIIVWIDDVQWGDADSARFLVELCRPGTLKRCLLVLSHREAASGRRDFLRHLTEAPVRPRCLTEAGRLTVGLLPEEEARALAKSLLPQDEDLDQKLSVVCREAAGSPLLIVELAHYLARQSNVSAQASLTLDAVVDSRLSELSPIARSIFEAVCVSGAPVRETVVSDIVGQPDLSEPITELVSAHLVRERSAAYPDALVPFHDGLRESFLRRLDDARIRHEHLRLARSYERLGASEAEAIAYHYAAAGNEQRASRWAEIAGDTAQAALAFDRAVKLFRRALEASQEGHTAVLKVKLATALADAGKGSEAAPLFLESARTADPQMALEYRRRAAEQWLVSGRVQEGRRILREVFRDAGMTFPQNGRLALLQLLALRLRQHFAARNKSLPASSEPTQLELMRIDSCRAAWPISFVSTLQAAVIQARFLTLARRTAEPYRLALGLGMEAVQRSIDGGAQRAVAEALRLEALELTERLDHPHATAFLDFVDGHIGYMGGEWSRAREALERAEQRLRRRCRSVTWELNSTRFFWGNALYHLGHYDELASRVDAWLRDAEEREDHYARAGFRIMRARHILHQHGSTTVAEQELSRALAEWPLEGLGVHRFMAELLRVQVHLARGEAEKAVQSAQALERAFRSSVMSRIQLCRVHVLSTSGYAALALAAESSGAIRRRALSRSLARARLLRQQLLPWAIAHATYIEGTACRLRSDERADALLEAATQHFDSCGMRYSAAAVRARSGRDRKQALRDTRAGESWNTIARPATLIAVLAPGWPQPAGGQSAATPSSGALIKNSTKSLRRRTR